MAIPAPWTAHVWLGRSAEQVLSTRDTRHLVGQLDQSYGSARLARNLPDEGAKEIRRYGTP